MFADILMDRSYVFAVDVVLQIFALNLSNWKRCLLSRLNLDGVEKSSFVAL